MLTNLETQRWPQDWKTSVFIPIPNKGNAKECSNYHIIALISLASKVMPKSFKLGFSNLISGSSAFSKSKLVHLEVLSSHTAEA